ncbi:hypothetical protein BMS3Bbin15_01122 [archaeon BMS3Bbin15]|nr:hypothetical protein BMS3Bbin15_01122 [archaeon BMS3Bbin15]
MVDGAKNSEQVDIPVGFDLIKIITKLLYNFNLKGGEKGNSSTH